MSAYLKYTIQPWLETFSEIIDVRSPSEFAEDRIPNAINLPVLDDEERAKVGTIYKQVSPFQARKVGAALVAQNIAQHLKNHLSEKDKNYSPLIYCWRGGQRSRSMATILIEIGWQVTLLEGGYKTYRSYVREQLQSFPQKFTYLVLSGLTGSGKTRILKQMAQQSFQVLDLEALANHRGSLLGEEWESESKITQAEVHLSKQPSQKYFESLLLQQLKSFDPTKPVWLEAESNKIGRLYLPQSLWEQMKQSSCVEVSLPLESRIEWLLQEYPHVITHPEFIKEKLLRLKSRYGSQKINEWYQLIAANHWDTLVKSLLECHYDPSYLQSTGKYYAQVKEVVYLTDLSEASINSFIEKVRYLSSIE